MSGISSKSARVRIQQGNVPAAVKASDSDQPEVCSQAMGHDNELFFAVSLLGFPLLFNVPMAITAQTLRFDRRRLELP